jgi:hypothetical protein
MEGQMNLNDFYAEVASCADTDPAQQIDAAIVSRVLASAFTVLADKDPCYVLRVVARGIEVAEGKKG